MFGKILSTVVKVVGAPIDVTNTVFDKVTGGSGSKRSRKQIPILGDIEDCKDIIADDIENWDE